MDLASLVAGASIGTISSLLTLVTSHVLQRRLQDRQWSREDALRREQQTREDIKPLIEIPGGLTKGCFPRDTRITLFDGQRKPIQDVRIGDALLTYDPHGRHRSSTAVSRIITSTTDVLIELNDTLCTTNSHRIICSDGVSVRAADLTVGLKLVSLSGEDVDLVRIRLLRQDAVVYNLETEGQHNFFANEFLTGDYFSKTEIATVTDDALAAKRREIKRS